METLVSQCLDSHLEHPNMILKTSKLIFVCLDVRY